MAVHVGQKPTFPLEFAGYTFPGYTNARDAAVDETLAADYHA